MGKAVSEHSRGLNNQIYPKVHVSICKELKTMLDGVTILVPAIESAQPGCKSGILELCSLNNSLQKGYLVIQYCVESSKLYAVITRKVTIARCERIRAAIVGSLSFLASLVGEPLCSQITKFLYTIKNIRLDIDPHEEEAGEVLVSLFRQVNIDDDTEMKCFQVAVSRLNLTSSKDLLIETRCIKNLMDHLCDSDTKKEKILNYLFYVLQKYGRTVLCETSDCDQIFTERDLSDGEREDAGVRKESSFTESDCNDSIVNRHQIDIQDTPPEEFICPISGRLMYDPVNIASGQTYERVWIERWFKDGHDTCPMTQQRLMNLKIIPNSSIKRLISQWCQSHGILVQNPCLHPVPSLFHMWDMLASRSISSLDNVSEPLLDNVKMHMRCTSDDTKVSIASSNAATCSDLSHIRVFENTTDSCSPMFIWNDDYRRCGSFAEFSYDSYLKFLTDLCELPSDKHKKALEDVKLLFSCDYHTLLLMLSNGFEEALVSFLKDAYYSSNTFAQHIGLQIFEAYLRNSRHNSESVNEVAAFLLPRVFDSKFTSEALSLISVLCQFPGCISVIVESGICSSLIEVLKAGEYEHSGRALELLCQLSSHDKVQSAILSSGFLSTLVPLLRDDRLARSCLRIFVELCSNGAGAAIVETGGCLHSILELLNFGGPDEQADAVAILYALCSASTEYSLLIIKADVSPSLHDISVNGTPEGVDSAKKLLDLLRDVLEHAESSCYDSQTPSLPPHCLKRSMAMKKKPSKSSAVFGTKSFLNKCKYAFRK